MFNIWNLRINLKIVDKEFIKEVMRSGCFLNLGNVYFWKRKISKKEGRLVVKVKEDLKVKIEECWIWEDVVDKLYV